MKLNEEHTTHLIVDKKSVHVAYCFSKEDVCGKVPEGNIWAVMSFIHPETKQKERLKVYEDETILNASEDEIHAFVEREVECFLKDCEELYR